MGSHGMSFVLPEEEAVWDRWQCPALDGELERLGSPLLTVPTPGRELSGRQSAMSTVTSSAAAQHVRVTVRVRPPAWDASGCVEVEDEESIRIVPPAAELDQPDPRTPGNCARTPGRAPTTPGAAGRTPGGRTPGGPGGRTPGGARTPGAAGRTPGRTPGGARTPGRTPGGAYTPGRTPGARTPGAAARTPGGRANVHPVAAVPKRFNFDGVCGPDSTQADVWEQARPLVDVALGGANATVFAYGQTGSGKTYTMIGTAEQPGVVPRAIDRIYEFLAASPEGTEWRVALTFVELYNDGFRDLLAPTSRPGQKLLPFEQVELRKEQAMIQLHETKGARGAPATSYLTGSSTFRTQVGSKEQLLALLAQGNAARSVGTTTLNERSSRSHAVITLNLDSKPAGDGAIFRSGKLHLVDLAGSEALTTGAESVLSAETRAINVSLTALCDVLQALSKNHRRPRGTAPVPVPYRNHKLTRLLADSLGGSSHTLMVAAVQMASVHYRSTLTTLKFASRARDITVRAAPVAPEMLTGADLAALKAKVADLHERLRRREDEIERLESLQSAREAMTARESERKVSEAAWAGAKAASDLQSNINDLRGLADAERAERDYAVASLEAQMVLAAGHQREALLEALLVSDDLEAMQSRAEAAEAKLALATAQRDEVMGQAQQDCDALEKTADAWRADREALAAANSRLASSALQQQEASQLSAKLDESRLAVEHSSKEMDAIRALIAVLDAEGVEKDKSSPNRQLLWLTGKLREGLVRYDEAGVKLPKRSSKTKEAAKEGDAPPRSTKKRGKSSVVTSATPVQLAPAAALPMPVEASPPPPVPEEMEMEVPRLEFKASGTQAAVASRMAAAAPVAIVEVSQRSKRMAAAAPVAIVEVKEKSKRQRHTTAPPSEPPQAAEAPVEAPVEAAPVEAPVEAPPVVVIPPAAAKAQSKRSGRGKRAEPKNAKRPVVAADDEVSDEVAVVVAEAAAQSARPSKRRARASKPNYSDAYADEAEEEIVDEPVPEPVAVEEPTATVEEEEKEPPRPSKRSKSKAAAAAAKEAAIETAAAQAVDTENRGENHKGRGAAGKPAKEVDEPAVQPEGGKRKLYNPKKPVRASFLVTIADIPH